MISYCGLFIKLLIVTAGLPPPFYNLFPHTRGILIDTDGISTAAKAAPSHARHPTKEPTPTNLFPICPLTRAASYEGTNAYELVSNLSPQTRGIQKVTKVTDDGVPCLRDGCAGYQKAYYQERYFKKSAPVVISMDKPYIPSL